MASSSTKLARYRGDNYPLIVTLKENGTAVDLTTSVVTMTLGFDTPLSITATINDAVGGIAQFDFDQTHVGEIAKVLYDIQVVDGGITTTYVKDLFEITEDITK